MLSILDLIKIMTRFLQAEEFICIKKLIALGKCSQCQQLIWKIKNSMKKLYRYPEKGYVGGVCYGLGEHTNIDPIIWRVITVFGGLGFAYLVLWIFLKKG